MAMRTMGEEQGYMEALIEHYKQCGDFALLEGKIQTFIESHKYRYNADGVRKDLETIVKWDNLKNKTPVIDNAQSYLDTLELFCEEIGTDMSFLGMRKAFVETYQLDTKFQIDSTAVGYDIITPLKKIIKGNNRQLYLELLKSYYEKYGTKIQKWREAWIEEEPEHFELNAEYSKKFKADCDRKGIVIKDYDTGADLTEIKKAAQTAECFGKSINMLIESKVRQSDKNHEPKVRQNNKNHKHIEIKLLEDAYLFYSCYFEGNTAYLYFYDHHGGIRIDCRTGAYSTLENTAKYAPTYVETAQGTTLYGFVNSIAVFYQIVSGNNGFSSVENVLNSFPYQANNAFRKYNLKMEMTRKSLTFTHNGRPVSLEDVAHILVSDPQPEKQNQTKKLSITEEWSVIKYNMGQEVSDNYGFVIPADTTNFSATTYICPECGNHISKVLLPKDTVIALTGGKRMKIDKAFACKHCNNFFAPFSNGRLDSGIIAYLKVNDSRFKEIVQMMDDNYRLPDSY